ncbi:CBS domain-containing protein [Pseudonocardia sp. RS11V-5]|uniref:CBS domain-containing protein n=1 Tax=Pseudonocardia terrae TaxID=2905831 RepID=UPI001E57735E|nr:CBS domain-containing protein [Pseudonocardia terrae]MCE3556521.1 CBS domain-containing protein [Pseudonocardia terrae]
MRVREVMSRPALVVAVASTVRDAAAALAAHGLSDAPVVDERERFVGMLAEADLVTDRAEGRRGATGVGPLVRTGLPTATLDGDLLGLVHRMREADVRVVPVLDGDRVAGIVTLSDLLRVLREAR